MIGISAARTPISKYRLSVSELLLTEPATVTGAVAGKSTRNPSAGFTLLEILIVIALMALVMSFAIPQFGAAVKINLSNGSRELANIIRATHDEAVLKGQVHRLAIDIDKNEYWVEAGDRKFLMRSADQEEEERRLDERRSEEEKEQKKPPFALAQGVTRKKKALPTGVSFSDVLNSRSQEPVKGGVVYAHFFPHGFVEKLIVHLKDNYNRENTLIVNSVTGKSKLYERYVKEAE